MPTRMTAVLLDLDGTLLHTAPDLIAAANAALTEAGIAERPSRELTPRVSGGAAAMLGCAADDIARTGQDFDTLMQRMLTLYEAGIACRSRFYAGMETVLDTLEQRGIPWGIVTNKHSRFTHPLLMALGIDHRPACIISGDTTAERKPHPLPLLEACRQLRTAPQTCVYVGDAKRDIEAGQRAGMATLVALYGYLADDDQPECWGANGLLQHPGDLIAWLDAEYLA